MTHSKDKGHTFIVRVFEIRLILGLKSTTLIPKTSLKWIGGLLQLSCQAELSNKGKCQ